MNKNILLGGILGGMLGAITALFLAPKSGKDLLWDIAHPLQGKKRSSHSRNLARSTTRRKIAKNIQKNGSHHPKAKVLHTFRAKASSTNRHKRSKPQPASKNPHAHRSS